MSFSVDGVYPGGSLSTLGPDWLEMSRETDSGPAIFQRRSTVAHVQNNAVIMVRGRSLELGGSVLLRTGQQIGRDRREIFDALSLGSFNRQLPAQSTTGIVEFVDWGLVISVADGKVESALLREPSIEKSVHPNVVTGYLIAPPSPTALGTQLQFLTEANCDNVPSSLLSIGGIRPGIKQNQLVRSGWRCITLRDDDRVYELHGNTAHVNGDTVTTVVGSALELNSETVIVRDSIVSSTLNEVFTALHLPSPPTDFRVEPSSVSRLDFVDWGLKVWTRHKIVAVSLELSSGGFSHVDTSEIAGLRFARPVDGPGSVLKIRFQRV